MTLDRKSAPQPDETRGRSPYPPRISPTRAKQVRVRKTTIIIFNLGHVGHVLELCTASWKVIRTTPKPVSELLGTKKALNRRYDVEGIPCMIISNK